MGGRGAGTSIRNRQQTAYQDGALLGQKIADNMADAIGKKGSPISIVDAVRDTNPAWSPNFAEYSMNCQRCVVAYELQRRGYDVEALPTYKGDKLPSVAYFDTKNNLINGRWKGAFRDAKNVNVGVDGNNKSAENKVIENIQNQMAKYGDGSRGVVQIFYRGGGGHVFNVEQVNGKTMWLEAQAGNSEMKGLNMKNIFTTMAHVDTGTVNLVRTDNLKLSTRVKNFVTQKKK